MFGPVRTHKFFHLLGKLFLVFKQFHINKVNHYYSANITQAKLAGNFSSSFQIGFKSILLLVIAHAFITTIYINYMQRFGMFNNKISSAWKVNCFTERCFYLPCNSIAVKYRRAIIMK